MNKTKINTLNYSELKKEFFKKQRKQDDLKALSIVRKAYELSKLKGNNEDNTNLNSLIDDLYKSCR